MFSLIDIGRLLLAVAASGVVIALPGLALARIFADEKSRVDGPIEPLQGVVFGLALLPLIDSLITRFTGVDAALAVTLALAVFGAVTLVQLRQRLVTAMPLALAAVWLVIVVIQWIDLDVAGKLFQPLTVVDTVKHAATTQAIVDGGAPPRDAFFLRPQSSSYYYFFYALTALVERIGCGLVDARAAVGGAVFWTGLGLFGLVRLAKRHAGLDRPSRTDGAALLIVAILAAGGLDIFAVLRLGMLDGTWLADPVTWNEQVTNWFENLLWVPHHVTGLIAAIVGLIALSGEAEKGPSTRSLRAATLAGLCFASSFGLSVWVTFALVVTVVVWGLCLLVEKRWGAVGLLVSAGLLALAFAIPQFIDLHNGRAPGEGLPIALTIRAFRPIDTSITSWPWRYAMRFVMLPLNYFSGFGALVSGAILFWTNRGEARTNEFGRVLAISAVVGLLLGTFLRSTIFNNDLGWRVLLFPTLAGTIWTITAIQDLAAAKPRARMVRAVPPFLATLICLGWATSLYAFVSLRAYPFFANDSVYKFVAKAPATERALRVAYEWADANLPNEVVLQHNPLRARAFAFSLYGRHRIAVSDAYGALYGADRTAVNARILALAPIYEKAIPIADVRAIADAAGIDDLIVTDEDPVWAKPDAFIWHVKPVYASDRVRIIATRTLGGAVADAR